jgi:hypothetical protein
MRRLILLLSPISLLACYSAYAQGSAQPSAPPAAYQGGRTTASGWTTRPPDPGNCGTPDEPRPCPPMPRNPLQYFPANRHKVTG